MLSEIVLFFLGAISGFFSGLLGIGGAVILIPLLMYIAPIFGAEFSFHEITGLSMTFVFFAGLMGAVMHFRAGNLKKDLVIFVGGAMFLFAFIGGTVSVLIPEKALTAVFAFVMAVAIGMMIKSQLNDSRNSFEKIQMKGLKNCLVSGKDKVGGALIGGISGVFSGLVGVGGATLIIPSLTYILNIPIKACIGSSLGIILAGSFTGFLGKAVTGQIPFVSVVFIVIGGILGSWLGSRTSFKLSGEQLKIVLTFFLIIVLIRILFSLFTGA